MHNNGGYIGFLDLKFYGILKYLNYIIFFTFESIFGKYRRWKMAKQSQNFEFWGLKW